MNVRTVNSFICLAIIDHRQPLYPNGCRLSITAQTSTNIDTSSLPLPSYYTDHSRCDTRYAAPQSPAVYQSGSFQHHNNTTRQLLPILPICAQSRGPILPRQRPHQRCALHLSPRRSRQRHQRFQYRSGHLGSSISRRIDGVCISYHMRTECQRAGRIQL